MSDVDPIAELRRMTDELQAVSGTAVALKEDVNLYAHQQRKVNLIGAGFMGVIAVLLVIGGFMLIQLISISESNREVLKETKATAAEVKSCTTVEGECYKRLRRQGGQTDAVIMLMKTIAAAPQCAKITETQATYEQCVRRAVQTQAR